MFQTIPALIVFLFPLAYSPGPGNMFFAAIGARFGFRATIPANLGYHLATWIITAAIGFGLVGALGAYPGVATGLKTAGALYVLRIAWQMLRAGEVEQTAVVRPASFLDGFMLMVLNPKAYIIIALMFTQFLAPADPDHLANVLLITTVFTLNNMIAFVFWTLVGDRLAALFKTSASARLLNRFFASILALVAIWMLFL